MNDYLKEIEEANKRNEKFKTNMIIGFIVCLVIATILTLYTSSKSVIDVNIVNNGASVTKEIKEDTTLSEFINEEGISIGEDDYIRLNEKYISSSDMDSIELKSNDEINIEKVVISQEVEGETVKYKTQTQKSNSLYKGETKVKQKGENGERTITYEVKTYEGEEVERTEVSNEITTKPVDKIVLEGTKEKETETNDVETSSNNNISVEQENPTQSNNTSTQTNNTASQKSTAQVTEPEEDTNTASSQDLDSCSISINGETIPCNG